MNLHLTKSMIKNRMGLTLVEIIVGLAIIGLLAVGFLTIFSSSFNHIFRMGSKTSAMSDAQEIIDSVYISGDTSDSFIQGIDTSETYHKIDDCAQLESAEYQGNRRILYCVGSETVVASNQTKFSVKVFYRNGNEYVMLSTIVP